MDNEPKNHTIVYSISYTQFSTYKVTDKVETTVYYKNYTSFDYLPPVAQSLETLKEYNAWWDWYNKYGYLEP